MSAATASRDHDLVALRIPRSASHVMQGELEAVSEGAGYDLIQGAAISIWIGGIVTALIIAGIGTYDLLNPPYNTLPWPHFLGAVGLGLFSWFGLYIRLRAIRLTKAARDRDQARTVQ